MKLFGEFLIEKNVIGNETLAKALVMQIKSLPSIPEVVLESNLLTVDQLLSVLRLQQGKRDA